MTQPVTHEYLAELNRQYESRQPQDVLRWAVETYGERLAVVTSFQPTGIITLHMLQDIAPRTVVITLDTGMLFPETYALIDTLQARFDINLRRITPEMTVEQQAAAYGDKLWEQDPDLCCHLRKTVPLQNALNGYTAWVAGLRRDQSATRAATPVIGWDNRHHMVKVCPFAAWTESMVWSYLRAHDLPYNPLHDQSYPSIGCYPCTQAASSEDDLRGGRWSNNSKTECGIHVSTYNGSVRSRDAASS